jgi:hypothetical protein
MITEWSDPVRLDTPVDQPATRGKVRLYVNKISQLWIVLDGEGQFWMLPPVDNDWEGRQPYHCDEHTELIPVPSHYRYTLGLPF